jgi:DNA-binding SARP family transcriptional activator/tetratricopeptide (TPR) repeat protein
MKLLLSDSATFVDSTGRSVDLAARDAALLAWLALEGPTARVRLAALLWPDSAPETARNSLRQRLFQLKKLLGVELVSGTTTLALADGVSHDLEASDEVLGDHPHDHGAEYAAWLFQQRERRRSRMRQSLVKLSEMAEQVHDHADALSHAHELLALEPLSEAAHRRVMRLHYLRGDRAAALLAFDHCEQLLKNEVGVRPSAETLALLATIESASPRAAIAASGPVPSSVLRPPRLIGRDRELATFAAGWQAGQVVALIGEAGLGKTRLLQAFMESHAGTVRAAGRPGDSGVPFATLARLLRAVVALSDRRADTLLPAQTRSEIARVLPEFGGATGLQASEGQRLVLQRAVRELLASQPELSGLVVDDLHFADEASLEMLGALIAPDDGGDERVEGAGADLRWALAYRPAEAGSPVQALHDGLVDEARLAPVALTPLTQAALAELVDSLGLPGVDGEALAPGLARRTGGNPLFVLETLKQAWVDRTLATLADPQALPRPVSVGRLIDRRIGQLSPGALGLARVASIAGVDFDIALAEQVLGVSAMQFADSLNELEAAQVLRGNAFAHDLVFDSVRASVPVTIAAHTHGRVAQWLAQRSGEPARIAEHWIAAGQPACALPWLAQAADAAKRALRPKEYIAFMERKSAIEEASNHPEAAFHSLSLAMAELNDVDPAAAPAQSLCDRLDRLAVRPDQRARALLHRATMHKQRGEFKALAQFAQEAMTQSTAQGDQALIADCHNMLAIAHTFMHQDAQALIHLQASLDWVSAHGNDRERADAHGSLAVVYDNLARLDEALPHHEIGFDLSCAIGDYGNAAIASGNLACNRIDAGDLRAAEQALLQGQRVMAQYDSFSATAGMLQMMRALCLCHLGQYSAALQQAELGLASVRQHQPGYENHALLRLATCWWHLGQWARMPQLLDAARLDEGLSLTTRTVHALLSWRYACAIEGGAAAAVASARARLLKLLDDIGDDQRPDLRLPVQIELAAFDEPSEALATLERVRAEAEHIGYGGILLAAHIRTAAAAASVDLERGRRAAQAALHLAASRQTTVLLPAELWLHCGRALLAAGDHAHGAEVLAQGQHWLRTTVRQHVPEPFRDSFLHRNPVNRALLAMTALTIDRG